MKSSKISYVVVGAFVLLILAATLATIMIMAGKTTAMDSYHTVYANVSGLRNGTRVMNEGFPVGEVSAIIPEWKDNKLQFRIEMRIRQGWQFPDDSEALVAASGILAAVVVEVRNGKSTTFLPPGSQIRAGGAGNLFAVMTDVADQLTGLAEYDVKPLLNTLNQTARTLDKLMSDKGDAFMAALLKSAEDLSSKTPQITSGIKDFLSQLGKVASDENIQSLDDILQNVEASSKNFTVLTRDLQESRKMVDSILATLNSTASASKQDVERSLQALRYTLSEVARSIDSVTHNIDNAGRNINEFTREIRQNPSILLRSRQAEDGPGAQ